VDFRVFVQTEFGKHNKQNKTTAKSVGHGIANSITDKEVEQIKQLKAQALFVAELANSMQEQSQKQFKETMELFKAKLDAKNLIRAISREEKARSRRKSASIVGWRCGTSPKHVTNLKPMLPRKST
jgi:hypothetical protein